MSRDNYPMTTTPEPTTAPDLQPVSSSALAAVGYDAAVRVLIVQTRSGHRYTYSDVTAEEHAALLGADSIGKHWLAVFRGKRGETRQ